MGSGRAQEVLDHRAQVIACCNLYERLAVLPSNVYIYPEESTSRRRSRPLLRQLLRDASEGRFEMLAVFRLGVLSRGRARDLFRVLEALIRAQVRVVSVCDDWWTPDAPAEALRLRRNGISWDDVAQRLGVDPATARRLCRVARSMPAGGATSAEEAKSHEG